MGAKAPILISAQVSVQMIGVADDSFDVRMKTNTDWTEINEKVPSKWSILKSTDLDGLKGQVDCITQTIENALKPAVSVQAD